MAGVSDTTPLNYLIVIGVVDVLPQLFGSVLVPEAVTRELSDARAPAAVRQWAARPPAWLLVQRAIIPSDRLVARLQAGERDAITLALEIAADLILLDEVAARREASRLGLR